MTRTVQFHSPVYVEEGERPAFFPCEATVATATATAAAETGREDNASLLVSAFDSLHNLHTALEKLDYVMRRKIIEMNMLQETGGRK